MNDLQQLGNIQPAKHTFPKLPAFLLSIIILAGAADGVSAAIYNDNFTADPATFSCGYYASVELCGSYRLLGDSPRMFYAGDVANISVAFTSPLAVPSSKTANDIYLGYVDADSPGGPGLPGPYVDNFYSTLIGYSGPPNPIGGPGALGGPFTTGGLHGYASVGGFCCGYGEPSAGFSATGLSAQLDIVTGDPTPFYVAVFGYYVELVATPEVLAGFAGGTVGHPVILPSGQIGAISSAISGGTSPSSDFYDFVWTGGLFQTSGTIVGANPLADFHFQLLNPYSHAVLDDLLLNSADGFSQTLTLTSLAAGAYEIGMYTDSPFDPQFTINFNTPVGSAVPEPVTWLLMSAGFGVLGSLTRRRRTRLSPA